MAFRGVPERPDPEPGTYARLRRDLTTAEGAILRILEAAPLALDKYKDAGTAGRAVADALARAVREHTEAEGRWLRYKRERSGDGR
jgi:hypothetical protein